MSTLTKVFAVLLSVFSIAFTTMAVSHVSQTADWRDTALKYEDHARVADANLRNLIAANAAELAAAHDVVQAQQDRVARMEEELQAAKNGVSRLRAELKRAESDRSNSEAMNRGILAQLESCSAGRDEYRAQRDRLEHNAIDLERRNMDMNDRVNEQTAQIAVLLEQTRHFEQQIHILQQDSGRVSRGPGGGRLAMEAPAGMALPDITALTPAAITPIRGHVVEVSGSIVTLSVGSADGVKKDMVFVVHRGEKYLGDLKIEVVNANQAAGRPVGAAFVPRLGDQVADVHGMAASRG